MMEGDKTHQENQFQFRGPEQQNRPPPRQQPYQQGPPPPGQGHSQGPQPNANSSYKPYGQNQGGQGKNFEDENSSQFRQEHQQKKKKMLIVFALVAVFIIILTIIIGVVLFLVLYEESATLTNVEVSHDWEKKVWNCTGKVKILGSDSKSITNFDVALGGSAVGSSGKKGLETIQYPMLITGGNIKLEPGEKIGFAIEAPLKAGLKEGKTYYVAVKLYHLGELIETVEVDVSRFI